MKSNVLVLIPVVSAVEHQRDARPNQQNTHAEHKCRRLQNHITIMGELIKHYFHNDPYQLLSHLSGSGATALRKRKRWHAKREFLQDKHLFYCLLWLVHHRRSRAVKKQKN